MGMETNKQNIGWSDEWKEKHTEESPNHHNEQLEGKLLGLELLLQLRYSNRID